MLDAYLRHKMFPEKILTPFDEWLPKQLRLQKIVNTPRKEPLGADNYKDYRSIRKGDKVWSKLKISMHCAHPFFQGFSRFCARKIIPSI